MVFKAAVPLTLTDLVHPLGQPPRSLDSSPTAENGRCVKYNIFYFQQSDVQIIGQYLFVSAHKYFSMCQRGSENTGDWQYVLLNIEFGGNALALCGGNKAI